MMVNKGFCRVTSFREMKKMSKTRCGNSFCKMDEHIT